MRRHHHGAAAGRNAVAMQEGAGGIRQHHPGPVVVGEHQRPLGGARRKHHVLRPDLPHPLARGMGRRLGAMVGQALGQRDEIVIVIAEGLGARQNGRTEPVELRQDAGDPGRSRRPVDHGGRLGQQRSAELGGFVAKDHTLSSPRGRESRRETGRAAARHHHVAMRVAAGVGVGIGLLRRDAEAGGAADQGLEQLRPERRALDEARPHEGLVVEACRQERRQQRVDRPDIEAAHRPGILARGHEPFVELDLGHAQVRRLPGAVSRHGGERVRLVGAGREQAARTVVLERTTKQVDAVGEQRRGERVAVEADIGMAVEGEAQRHGAVDATAAREPESARVHWGLAAHGVRSSPAPIRGASPSGAIVPPISGRGWPDL